VLKADINVIDMDRLRLRSSALSMPPSKLEETIA
jgi:uncharacterized protein YaeQ